jgi:hypothetical protein
MYVINKDDKSIYVTRGDTVLLDVGAEYNKELHTFVKGDILRLKIYKKKNVADVVLKKDVEVTGDNKIVQIYLSSEDTKLGDLINKPVDYWYEIELNPDTEPQTIIGYDEDGAKIFKLFPEGADLTPYAPERSAYE